MMSIFNIFSTQTSAEAKAYDVILHIQNIRDILDLKEWPIEIKPGVHTTWNESSIGIIGLYNKGKTFILNKITGLAFESGNAVNTIGLSMKFFNLNNENNTSKHIIFDTAGMNSPINLLEELEKEKKKIYNKMSNLMEHKICAMYSKNCLIKKIKQKSS